MPSAQILCHCTRGTENKPDRSCPDCGGSGTVCGVCMGRTGRIADAPCPACDAGDAYFASLPPSSESMRIAREIELMLA